LVRFVDEPCDAFLDLPATNAICSFLEQQFQWCVAKVLYSDVEEFIFGRKKYIKFFMNLTFSKVLNENQRKNKTHLPSGQFAISRSHLPLVLV